MTKTERMEHKRANALRRTESGHTKMADRGLAPIKAYERWDQRLKAYNQKKP